MKFRDIKNMNEEERNKKLKELRMELIKKRVGRESKTNIREIKKAIARILTIRK